jgi:Porin subfamily
MYKYAVNVGCMNIQRSIAFCAAKNYICNAIHGTRLTKATGWIQMRRRNMKDRTMNKLFTAFAALAASASVAVAADLPKKNAPAAAPVAAAAPAACDALSVSYGQDFAPDGLSSKIDDGYGVGYSHCLGPMTVGASYSGTYTGSAFKQNLEGQVGYNQKVTDALSIGAKLGVGERFLPNSVQFPYYALYGTVDYRINDSITLNGLQYRYRNAFDTSNNYESHRIGTGASYNITKNVALTATVYRDYDNNFSAIDNGVALGATVRF